MFRAAPRVSSALKQVLRPLNVLGFCDFVKVLAERPNDLAMSRGVHDGNTLSAPLPVGPFTMCPTRRIYIGPASNGVFLYSTGTDTIVSSSRASPRLRPTIRT